MPPTDDLGSIFLPLDRATRERLMRRAKAEGGRNPLELGAELLSAKLEADERADRPDRLN